MRPSGHEGQVREGLDPWIGRAHVGDGVHAVSRGDHDAGVATQALLDRCRGCQPWMVMSTSGSPFTSTSNRSPPSPYVHGGSRCSSPMNQLTAARDHLRVADEGLPGEPLCGDLPGLDHAYR